MRYDRPLFRTAWLAAAFCLGATPALARGGHSGSSGSHGGGHSGSSGGSHSGRSHGSSGSHSGSRSGSSSGSRSVSGSHSSVRPYSGRQISSSPGSRVVPYHRGGSGSGGGAHGRPPGGHPGDGHHGGAPGWHHDGHGHYGHYHHRSWYAPLYPVWGVPWFGFGCTWLWSDWGCWGGGPGLVVIQDGSPDVWGADIVPWEQPESDDTPSRLHFDISPEDAVVYVDDGFAGVAGDLNDLGDDGYEVPPGEHVVTIVRPGFEQGIVRIETFADEDSKVEVDLEEATNPAPAAPTAPPARPAKNPDSA